MDSWFAENITASDEYGFTTAAATSHVWFGILFARSISKSRIKLNEGIVSDGLAVTRGKNSQLLCDKEITLIILEN